MGADSTLSVNVPTALRETDVKVMLVVQPINSNDVASSEEVDGKGFGYPPGFFEETYGSFRDDPLVRLPQGEAEQREPIL